MTNTATSAPRQQRRPGLIGGMSWRSTELYYRRLNQAVEERLGPHRSFRGMVWNMDYADLIGPASAGRWDEVEAQLVQAARGLVAGGCDLVVLTAVTAHRFHEPVLTAAGCPVPHVLAGAARELDSLGVTCAGILGTATTCATGFADHHLARNGRTLLRLDGDAQAALDTLIQGALTVGDVTADGRAQLDGAVRALVDRGAEAVVLACTELPLLLPLATAPVPLLDCVALHVDEICRLIVSS
ncbi:aspartate/glutamate racemase family protein [Reyranella sp. CPCC 100927]|uniref:aspartate/glutamate racemase family protein n=1 Tax=Reyranella sp. CPCC 100927 TaxID=2599616 RepID=UPI0011B7FF58|nr:amino acid racemase [Reyranella sp. CPCC 100927]TWT10066.1 amino acid racemase [Reyranella sp. CPCC 100927]